MTAPRKSAEAKPTANLSRVREAEREVGDHLEDQRQERIRNRDGVAPDPTDPDFWAYLARPFDADWAEKLPRNVKRQDEDKGPCEDTPRGRKYSADGHYCGGWHARSIHLDYIGHAGITMRLNEDVGPDKWDWEPMATTPEGLPLMGRDEFWIKLTILGVTKYGVGDDYRGSAKQAIGDALRNAAMRFGLGTYLWAKSEKALTLKANTKEVQETPAEHVQQAEQAGPPGHVMLLKQRLASLPEADQVKIREQWTRAKFPKIDQVTPQEADVVDGWIDNLEEEGAKAVLGERLGAQEQKQEQQQDT